MTFGRRLAAVGVALGVAACGLFPSIDDLSGEPDGSRDAAVTEAGDGGDAGRWCDSLSPAPSFCDDFDDDGGPFARWTNQFLRAGGTVSRDPGDFRSPPNALLAVSPPTATASAANLHRDVTTTVSTLHVAYDMKIDARDTAAGYAEVNYIDFSTADVPFAFYLRVYDDPNSTSTATIEAYPPDGGVLNHDLPLLGAPRFDTWTRVGVDIDLASATRTMTVTIDGATAAQQTLEPDLYAPGPVSVHVGIGYTGSPSTTDWRIRYDDVTIDWQ